MNVVISPRPVFGVLEQEQGQRAALVAANHRRKEAEYQAARRAEAERAERIVTNARAAFTGMICGAVVLGLILAIALVARAVTGSTPV
jgi:hypothetical protein